MGGFKCLAPLLRIMLAALGDKLKTGQREVPYRHVDKSGQLNSISTPRQKSM